MFSFITALIYTTLNLGGAVSRPGAFGHTHSQIFENKVAELRKSEASLLLEKTDQPHRIFKR